MLQRRGEESYVAPTVWAIPLDAEFAEDSVKTTSHRTTEGFGTALTIPSTEMGRHRQKRRELTLARKL
jgi:hypothetical protein